MNEIVNLISRWLHIIPAMILFGGVTFLRFGWSANNTDSSTAAQPSLLDNRDDVRRRWARLVMLSTLLLLVSGLYNSAVKEMTYELDMVYRGLLGVKILLALGVFFLTAVLSGRSERAKRFRASESRWLSLTWWMMLVIVLIAGYMKVALNDYLLKG